MNKKTSTLEALPTRLLYTQDEVKDYITDPIIQYYRDGLNVDEIKKLTDADKYYYDNKNFEIHKSNIQKNIISCRERCSKITGVYDSSFGFEACKKGCHIESPYYCKECPNKDMYGKFFYFIDEDTPINDCNKSGNEKDCEKGKTYFREIWHANHDDSGNNTKSYPEQSMYKMANIKLHGNDCMGDNKLYNDTACDEEITLEDRYDKLLKSYKDYKTDDKRTYNNMIKNIIKLKNENNKITSSNNIKMDNLLGRYEKLQEGMINQKETRKIRLEDNKLLGESEMYKKIAISILGITLLIITTKKLNNL